MNHAPEYVIELSESSTQLTGALTLDALGDDSAVFVFQIGSTLTTASNSSVTLINGGSGCNVFWQVGTSATLGSTTAFVGNVLASASITLVTSTNVSGRVLALNGAVTMDSNSVTIPPECQCVASLGPGCAGSGGFVPNLSLNCPIPGSDVTLKIEQGLGGAMAVLFVGAPVFEPVLPNLGCGGCTLFVRPGPFVLFVQLASSGAGHGTFSLLSMVPASATGTFALQVFVIDGGAPCGFSASNGLLVTIG